MANFFTAQRKRNGLSTTLQPMRVLQILGLFASIETNIIRARFSGSISECATTALAASRNPRAGSFNSL
jgi:hypothetical protein